MAAPQQPNSTYMSLSTAPKGSTGSREDAVKPTLLAFHGSGSNATVHMVQLARLTRVIKPYFDIESLEGTCICTILTPGVLEILNNPTRNHLISFPLLYLHFYSTSPLSPIRLTTHPPLSSLPLPSRPRRPPLLRWLRPLQALAAAERKSHCRGYAARRCHGHHGPRSGTPDPLHGPQSAS